MELLVRCGAVEVRFFALKLWRCGGVEVGWGGVDALARGGEACSCVAVGMWSCGSVKVCGVVELLGGRAVVLRSCGPAEPRSCRDMEQFSCGAGELWCCELVD